MVAMCYAGVRRGLGMTEQRVRTVWRDAGVVHSTCGVTLDGDQLRLIAEKEYGCAMLRRRKP